MKGPIVLAVALFLGLAGCSAATAPNWQARSESAATPHQQSAGQTGWLKALGEDPALGHWYTLPYFNLEVN